MTMMPFRVKTRDDGDGVMVQGLVREGWLGETIVANDGTAP